MMRQWGTQEEIEQKGKVGVVGERMQSLPAGVKPILLGSRMRIWKQDPSVSDVSIRSCYVHGKVDEGPKDPQIAIAGMNKPVAPDMNGDFLFDPSDEEAFDAVHTFAVVRQVLTMYQRLLGRAIRWQWNLEGEALPIQVWPYAGSGLNAYYSREDKMLGFFVHTTRIDPLTVRKLAVCRSLDVIAHETGHAVLDALQPGWWAPQALQARALHESFADLTSLFTVLSQMDLVEYIIVETKADLHQKNILAQLCEEFGSAAGLPSGLRNLDRDITVSQAGNKAYDLSQVLSGAVYDVLADVFTTRRNPRSADDAMVLYETARDLFTLYVKAVCASPPTDSAVLADVANQMVKIAETEYPDYVLFLLKQFEIRELTGANAVRGFTDFGDTAGCCGTILRWD